VNIDDAFRALILSSEAVTALIGDRLYDGQNTIDVRADLPKVIYSLIREDTEQDDDGEVGISRANYQLDAFAPHSTDCDEILKAIHAKLKTHTGTHEGVDFIWITRVTRRHQKPADKKPGANTGPKRVTREYRVIYRDE